MPVDFEQLTKAIVVIPPSKGMLSPCLIPAMTSLTESQFIKVFKIVPPGKEDPIVFALWVLQQIAHGRIEGEMAKAKAVQAIALVTEQMP